MKIKQDKSRKNKRSPEQKNVLILIVIMYFVEWGILLIFLRMCELTEPA